MLIVEDLEPLGSWPTCAGCLLLTLALRSIAPDSRMALVPSVHTNPFTMTLMLYWYHVPALYSNSTPLGRCADCRTVACEV